MEEVRPLPDLIPKEREWVIKMGPEKGEAAEERELELRLAPPGVENWSFENGLNFKPERKTDDSLLSLGHFSSLNGSHFQKLCFSSETKYNGTFLQFQSTPQSLVGAAKDSRSKSMADLEGREKMSFPSAAINSSHKRSAPAPVVGWPPIHSSRRNLASSTSSAKLAASQDVVPAKVEDEGTNEKQIGVHRNGFFVKINMDGVPIGRKVDLHAYDSYPKLCSAVDDLFRGLLAAKRDSSPSGSTNTQPIKGLLEGSREYTLVYEDNEGDGMLVGDVPWHMFVSTVKRLRVLQISDLPKLSEMDISFSWRKAREASDLMGPSK